MTEISCRVKRSLWWMVPLAALEGGFMLVAPLIMAAETPKNPHAASPWLLLPLSLPMALVFFYAVLQMTRSLLFETVIANPEGLRWRGAFGPWKAARWEEISDFYLQKIGAGAIVETTRGKLRLSSGFTNLEQLKTFIAERATSAPARGWEMERFRASKPFTQRFPYWTKTQKWMAPGFVGVFGCLAILLGATSLFSPQSQAPAAPTWVRPPDMPWAMFYLPILMGVAVFGLVALLCVLSVGLMWRERSAAWLHRDEHLEISPRGVAWQSGRKRIEAAWDEVIAIHRLPKRGFKPDYRVETRRGDFTVWNSLESVGLWLGLVRQFAPHLAPPAPLPTTDIGGESGTWSGGKRGEGARVFHFRTSETRTNLWAPTLVSPCLLLIPFIHQSLQAPDELPAAPLSLWVWFGIGVAILATVGCWVVFARAAIWADETGLEWRVPFWKRRLDWSEIEAFGRDETGVFLRAGGKKRPIWRSFAPARQNELLQLIQSRATDATGNWELS